MSNQLQIRRPPGSSQQSAAQKSKLRFWSAVDCGTTGLASWPQLAWNSYWNAEKKVYKKTFFKANIILNQVKSRIKILQLWLENEHQSYLNIFDKKHVFRIWKSQIVRIIDWFLWINPVFDVYYLQQKHSEKKSKNLEIYANFWKFQNRQNGR